MLNTILLALAGILVFRFGYYIGNQIGRTQHIREELCQARRQSNPDSERLAASLVQARH
ncbi:MAG: hypothetical protein GWO16_14105 [Gammaproteobacteria bacterium]|nr:hypothetical protein [Gammaproteobacteria bacterium]NIR99063.1 hypothetical protein [Gammaproteobacteria bacterium]NIT64695.1 hypothetical protein [Gammaproteobacteria bacterium]NIV21653.1 hypothetical protein [Gammaproteobacteria bacterium]NIX10615.1 hypothetical protein [Gammaproteobacteria bacterium]